eukprot:2558212-Rhodomonas_salina.2
MEREIEEKRSQAIDNAREVSQCDVKAGCAAQNEAMYTLNVFLEGGEEALKARRPGESSEEDADEDEDEDEEQDKPEGPLDTVTEGESSAKGAGAKGVGYRKSKADGKKAKGAESDEDFGFLSEDDKKAVVVQEEERNENDGIQHILAGIWDEQIESVSRLTYSRSIALSSHSVRKKWLSAMVEAMVLGALVDIELISKEVIASQREGTFESPALQWPVPEIGVSETLALMCMGDNRFGQLGAGHTGPDGQVPKKVQQKLFKGGYPLQVVHPIPTGLASHQIKTVSCGWQHSMIVSQAGAVFSWGTSFLVEGFGGYGALGHGNKYNY